jgi:formylglycine-generating enzyme required for sulfatase activity
MRGSDPSRLKGAITCPACKRTFHAACLTEAPAESNWPGLGRWLVIAAAVLVLALTVVLGVWLLPGRQRPAGMETRTSEGSRGGGSDEAPETITEEEGKRHALLIGVRNYKHLPHLQFTENDVTELAELLRPADFQVVLLSDSAAADLQPTAANIRRHLERLVQKCGKKDTLLLAFAGHGLQADEQGDCFFCPMEGDPGKPESLVSLTGVYARLGKSRAGAKLMLVDACRNQGRGTARGIDGHNVPMPPRGVAALFSCSPGQQAFETSKLGKGHGVFFHFVLEGLRGKAKNDDGEVTWARLTEYVSRQVSRQVSGLIGGGARQTPHGLADLMGESPVLVRRQITSSIGMKLVLIPAGKFLMGSPTDEKDRNRDEPQHEVEITKPFYLGVCEVTQKQYRQIMGANPSCFSPDGDGKELVKGLDTDDFPVDNVLWTEASDFCKKLSAVAAEKKAGRVYRLPTEAEWEYACRAGTTTPFYFGNSLSPAAANVGLPPNDTGALGRTCKVGSYRPNAWGLYDMHGNVWEYVLDWYDGDYYKRSPVANPLGPGEGTHRLHRGGGHSSAPGTARSASRLRYDGKRYSNIGFRVVCVPASDR